MPVAWEITNRVPRVEPVDLKSPRLEMSCCTKLCMFEFAPLRDPWVSVASPANTGDNKVLGFETSKFKASKEQVILIIITVS